MIIFHVIVACLSLVYSGVLLFFPSSRGLKIAYILVALVVASGTYLALVTPAHLTQTCITGLIYLVVVGLELFGVRHRLVLITAK